MSAPVQFLTADELRAELWRACREAGSQLTFAERAGVHSTYLNAVLNGLRPPSAKLARALGYRAGFARVGRRAACSAKPLRIEVTL